MSKIIRVLVPDDANSRTTWETTLAAAEALSEAAGVHDAILLLHTRGQLDHTGLAGFLGPQVCRAIEKRPVALPWGDRLHCETMRTLKYLSAPSVIIAYYANMAMLDHVDGLHGVAGVIAVPWVPGELDAWAERWNAKVIGRPEKPPAALIQDPVVVRALESLSSVVNLATGLGNPMDKKAADETFRILRAKGHAYRPEVIKSWAIRRGWRPKDAAELDQLAGKIWALKNKPKLTSIYASNDRYERWKSDG